MIYLRSEEYDKNVRIDTTSNKAYIMNNGGEIEAPKGSKIVADATIGMDKISKEEYYS